MRLITLLICALALLGCESNNPTEFDLQGHRGARGVLPENTIPSFLAAVDQGSDTIEMDVVISSDSLVIVSHEPWMSAEICSHPDGTPVSEEEAQTLNLFRMTAAEIAAFDCGSRGNPRFPHQEPRAVHKPLLADAIAAIEAHADQAVRYNIEIKSRPDGDGTYHPEVAGFASLVYDVTDRAGVVGRTTFQSFDPRALEAIHGMHPEATKALLVSNRDGLTANLGRLSFQPETYSPNFELVHAGLVDSVHTLGMTIVPWTVNDQAEMRRLLDMGVDGIITDYPALGAELKRSSTQPSEQP